MAKGPGVRRPLQPFGRGFASQADISAKKGNPWEPDARHQRSEFSRREYENPDLDRYTRATRSEREMEGVAMDIKRVFSRQKQESDLERADRLAKEAKEIRRRKLVGISVRMHKKLRGEVK